MACLVSLRFKLYRDWLCYLFMEVPTTSSRYIVIALVIVLSSRLVMLFFYFAQPCCRITGDAYLESLRERMKATMHDCSNHKKYVYYTSWWTLYYIN